MSGKSVTRPLARTPSIGLEWPDEWSSNRQRRRRLIQSADHAGMSLSVVAVSRFACRSAARRRGAGARATIGARFSFAAPP